MVNKMKKTFNMILLLFQSAGIKKGTMILWDSLIINSNKRIKKRVLDQEKELLTCNDDKKTLKNFNDNIVKQAEVLQKTLELQDREIDVLRKAIKESPTISLLDDMKSGPTEREKLSPHSSINRFELRQILKHGWRNSNLGLYEVLVADTHSEEPIIDVHTVVMCEPFDKKRFKTTPIRKGDIIHYDGKYSKYESFKPYFILHEIIEVRTNKNTGNKEYRLKGRNNKITDGWLPEKAIKGRAYGISWGSED